jgi:3alpha(or 20beta)-hydroxysteroid dehydrogenase
MTNRVFVEKCDLTDWKDTEKTIASLISGSSLIPYALIHTATVRSHPSLPLVDSDPLEWSNIIRTNTMSAFHLLKAVLPYMYQQNEGRILLFGSAVSRSGLAKGSAYAASKAAMSNLCKSLALELENSGILINTLSPGPVQTSNEQFADEYRAFRQDYFEKQEQLIPIHRVAQVSDIYPICKFLVSDQNTYQTGEEIFLTGGKLC